MPRSLNEPPYSHCLIGLWLAGNCTSRGNGIIKMLDIYDPMTGLIESRLRRRLRKQGFRLVKSHARNPLALDYGHYCLVDLLMDRVYGTPRTTSVLNIDEVISFAQIGRSATGF